MPTDYATLPAGRELDLRLAVAIGDYDASAIEWLHDAEMMAYFSQTDDGEGNPACYGPDCYSTDEAAAFRAVGKLHARGLYLSLHHQVDGLWAAEFEGDSNRLDLPELAGMGMADTPALAICRAALEAMQQ